MHVVHVADHVSPLLGYQEFLLAKWMARAGVDTTLVTSNLNPPAPNYRESFEPLLGPRRMPTGSSAIEDVSIVRLGTRGEFRTRIWISGLEKAITQQQPDAIFVHGSMSPTTLRVCRLGRRLNRPVFVDNHMLFSVQDTSFLGRLAYTGARTVTRGYIVPRVTQFYGVTEESMQFLETAQGVPASRVALLPLGIDSDLFQFRPEMRVKLRQAWDIPEDETILMQTGKLDSTKNPSALADASSRVMLDHPDVWLVFIGNGPESEISKLRAAVASRGLEARFRLLPAVPVQELSSYMSAADLVAFPGAASMSALEAAACERLVLMNDLPASRWRAQMGVGQTFDHTSANGLARTLDRLLRSRDTWRDKGKLARESVLKNFSYERIVQALIEDIRRATNSG